MSESLESYTISSAEVGEGNAGAIRNGASHHHAHILQFVAKSGTIAQLSRIKELALYQGNLGHDRFMELLSPLDSPAPVLESLDISFLKFARDNKVPNYLFSGEAPRLSRLRLVGGDLNWQALPFTNLRSLEVRSTFAPPPEHIIFTLSNMPLLESFECEFHRATTHCTSTQCTVLVNLPRLVNLAIESDLPACKIKVMKDRRLNTVSVSLTQGLANDVIRRAQKTIHSLKVQQYAIILETCPETLEDAAQKNRCRSQLYFEFYPPKPPVVEIMTDIIQVLPSLAQTEILDVDVVSLPKAIWMNHFRGLSRLNTLRVGADCAGFLEVFSDSSLAMPGQSGHAAHFAFEALCELTLADWYFDEYCNFPDDGPWKSCYASLKDCLKARQEAGLTLELLMLENCNNVERYSVAPLRRYVKNLWRDGCTLYNSDDEEADG
ncbi:hypothetical protein FPV67DRAFT_1508606 [Lyophyllum atratum]|nr:hypothetical protein FPV67DRAFT_1508606 [Lyophyllum atratum]